MDSINKKNYKPDVQRMNKVADILGVNLNEPFQIQFFNHKNIYKDMYYKLTPEGLYYSCNNNNNYNQKSDALEGLLTGKHQVVKIES